MISINGGQLVAMLALMIPIVAIIMNNITKAKVARSGAALSEGAERELMSRADRLNERVAQLERILDAESPGWRSRN